MGNYTSELTQTAIGITYDQAGCLNSPFNPMHAADYPRRGARLSTTYSLGPWSGTVTVRGYGAAALTNGVQNLPASITRASISATGVVTQGVGNGNLLDTNTVKSGGLP